MVVMIRLEDTSSKFFSFAVGAKNCPKQAPTLGAEQRGMVS